MDDPGSLLPGHHSHEAALDFELAVLTNEQKKVVADCKRTVIVGRYESQAHVTVTEVAGAVTKRARMSPAASWAIYTAAREFTHCCAAYCQRLFS